MFSKLFIVIATISATAFAQFPAPSCYSGGTSGINDCSQFIATFCADVAATSIGPGDNVGRCFSVNGKRCDFIAFRDSSDSPNPPSEANCNTVLNGVVQSCPFGGKGKIMNAPGYVTFTLDPNAGACSTDVEPAGS